jgi:hypothetical protein
MARLQAQYTESHHASLTQQLDALTALKARQVAQLDLQLSRSAQAEHFKAARREERLKRIDTVFNDYQTWVRDTLSIEPVPFIQIIAVFTRDND